MKKKKLQEQTKKKADKMSLEQIEEKMTELALNCTPSTFFMNKTQIEMLEKVASVKIKREELAMKKQQQDQANATETKSEPITVTFVSAKGQENIERLARLDAEVQDALNGNPKNNA